MKAGPALLDPFIFQENLEMGQLGVDQIQHVERAEFGLRNDPAPDGRCTVTYICRLNIKESIQCVQSGSLVHVFLQIFQDILPADSLSTGPLLYLSRGDSVSGPFISSTVHAGQRFP